MSTEQKENKKQWAREYNKTEYGRAVVLSSAYRKIDKNKGLVSDITAEYRNIILGVRRIILNRIIIFT